MNQLAKPMVSMPTEFNNDQYNGGNSQQYQNNEFDCEMQFKTEQCDDF